MKTPTWKTKSGQVIPIHAMTTDHIKNAMGMIERKVSDWNRGNHPSYYMKEIPFERDYTEEPGWKALNKELELRAMGRN